MPRRRTISCENCGYMLLKRDTECEACGSMTLRSRNLLVAKVAQFGVMLIVLVFVYGQLKGLGAP